MYGVAHVTASDDCENFTSVSVYGQSAKNKSGDPQIFPIPDNTAQKLYVNTQISSADRTFRGATVQNGMLPPRIADIVAGSIKVIPDDGYVKTTEKNRKFTPKPPFSPLDNFAVTFDLHSCTYPFTIFSAAILTYDKTGKK